MHSTKKSESGYRPDIDGLRAVAIILVLGFHAFPKIIPGGFVGVDVFFVISGYLISQILQQNFKHGNYTLLTFYNRRIRRIFPVLILVLCSTYFLSWYYMASEDFWAVAKYIAAGAGFVSNFALWQEAGYFDATAKSKPLLHLWSLGIEEQFYLVWPLLLFGTRKLQLKAFHIALTLLVVSLSAYIYLIHHDKIAAFYSPLSRVWELMLGGSLALADIKFSYWKEKKWMAAAGSILGLFLILLAAFIFNSNKSYGILMLLPSIGAFLIIAAGSSAWVNRLVLSQRGMVGIGLISYALYLWHWPLLVFARYGQVEPLSAKDTFFVLLLSFVLAILCYFLIEKPIRAEGHIAAKSIVLCILMLLIGSLGYTTHHKHEWQSRLSLSMKNAKSYNIGSDEVSSLWRRHKCMLEGEEAIYATECSGEQGNSPTVMIWGDSHAAAIYPGLVKLQTQGNFQIAQYNATRCPSIFGYVSPNPDWKNENCIALNETVRKQIHRLHPNTLIITAFWEYYALDSLPKTIQTLKKDGIKNIIVIGDVPFAKVELGSYISTNWGKKEAVTHRANIFLEDKARLSDKKLKEVLLSAGVTYVSVVDALCDSEGCLTLVDETNPELTYIDTNHLSPAGAMVVLQSVKLPK